MDIIVCIKRVVATDTRVKIGADGAHIDPGGVQYIMSPYDEIAVERAIQLKTAAGAGSVTVLTVGPSEASKELRTALAMGADEALHLQTTEDLDVAATCVALEGAIRSRAYDLILTGKQATDSDDAAVGPRLAARLELPCVAFVSGLEVDGKTATATREIEGVTEIWDVDLPAVFTAQKGLAEPRYPSLKGIMAAKKKPLTASDAPAGGTRSQIVTLALPESRGEMVQIEATPAGMQTLLTALRNEKKVL
jgi:electron transfer flavoprotein beta subunit